LRHPAAFDGLEDGCDIRTVQEPLGDREVGTAIYPRVLSQGLAGSAQPGLPHAGDD